MCSKEKNSIKKIIIAGLAIVLGVITFSCKEKEKQDVARNWFPWVPHFVKDTNKEKQG